MWRPIILDVECIVCNKSLQKINHDPREAKRNMGKMTCRRSRTPNWSVDEKKYLLELIKERKEVVVTKNNNGPNYSEEKDVAWNEILRELTKRFGSKFSVSSTKKVKTQWQNMKRIAREEIALIGPIVEKFTRQTFEVCTILDMIKDGVLKKDEEGLNDTVLTTNIEVKAERMDDEMSAEPNCSGATNSDTAVMNLDDDVASPSATINQLDSSEHSACDANEFDAREETPAEADVMQGKRDAAAMTDGLFSDNAANLNPFYRQLQEFFRYSSDEKYLKMEALKEERQVVRAMRETAELNKIIAEQRLKHILWLKKREVEMYSGEPGSGAGRGGGGGGAIREAGGTFGKMEAAREDEYFYKKQKEQLSNLKSHLSKEISFHEEQIKRHEDAIRRHKEQMHTMDKK
ncbi:unnamed protein product [Chilo suppressalis]|uniref:Regulatory protein zeste n=1 Tax=Chilo suppressalis TaxID=168631 RepID=A0ABN8BA88_CHISP|nr:unnamed protein product [Chilo suppressalis]